MDEFQQELAARGIEWVTLSDGRRVALDKENTLLCPVCRADAELMPECAECVGRGRVDAVPFADRPWDEVIPGLWVGGHDCQAAGAPPNGDCIVTDEFELVVSLYSRFGYGPEPEIEHLHHRMSDAELDPDHHTVLDDLAARVAEAVSDGRQVLVRCQAGLNRSSLVAALAMIQLGWEPDAAIERIREARSPYALCNEFFVNYLRSKKSE